MEIATLTRRRPAPGAVRAPAVGGRRRVLTLPAAALLLLCVATLVGFFVFPTYPNYDSYYSLIWGRELLHGHAPSFESYRSPTEHPLAIAFGAVLALLGQGADRVLVFATLASLIVLAVGLYRLGRAAFTPVVGLLAAGLVCTRFDFPFLAARAYIDIPYLAFVIWAGVLEVERPRRGIPVFALLVCAGLMRPEAWLLGGIYFLWTFRTASWPRRALHAALTGVAPLTWAAVDDAVTGRPLYSLQHTSGLAEELGRQGTLADIPRTSVNFLINLDKAPVFYAGVLGLVLAVVLTPRRSAFPLAGLAIGLGTFVLVGLAGLSIIDRYLLVPSLMVMVFAAVTLGGWSMLTPGRLRTAWMAGAVLVAAYGLLFTATRVNFTIFENQLTFRGESHRALRRVLNEDAVRAAARCPGPLSTPNHKLVPDVRWVLGVDASARDVVARSDPAQAARVRSGRGLYIADRTAFLRQALVDPTDRIEDQLPLPGFRRVGTSDFYGVYASC